jgi:hypothetical protein
MQLQNHGALISSGKVFFSFSPESGKTIEAHWIF